MEYPLVGIIGKPNVGKSTFFKALTLKSVEISNRPFTTIEPNVGIGYVRKKCVEVEFNVKCNPQDGGFCIDGNRFIPVKIMDVAGLVPGAHEGRGLGNKFLDDLRQAEGFILVIDASASTDEEGNIIGKGKGNPERDIEFVLEEINIWFFNVIKRNFEKIIKKVKIQKIETEKAIKEILSGLGIREEDIRKTLEETDLKDKPIWDWNEEDLKKFSFKLREISKPFIVAANKCDVDISGEVIKELKERFKDIDIVPCSAEAEVILKLAARNNLIKYIPGDSSFEIVGNLDEKKRKILEMIEELVLKRFGNTGVQQAINKLIFEKLGYIVVYPVATEKLTDNEGNILPHAFLVRKGTKLIEFAEKIHSDFAKYFVKGINMKTKKIIGKDYVLNDNDVIRIVISK